MSYSLFQQLHRFRLLLLSIDHMNLQCMFTCLKWETSEPIAEITLFSCFWQFSKNGNVKCLSFMRIMNASHTTWEKIFTRSCNNTNNIVIFLMSSAFNLALYKHKLLTRRCNSSIYNCFWWLVSLWSHGETSLNNTGDESWRTSSTNQITGLDMFRNQCSSSDYAFWDGQN